ncbi:hypothetical protein [Paractinoplanes globisporus]|uniref:Uncharacterized protein n=1 Tax=Paractinoplanes globisporus TaxID=113565 RepID=A0ABW6WQ82_9ACTN
MTERQPSWPATPPPVPPHGAAPSHAAVSPPGAVPPHGGARPPSDVVPPSVYQHPGRPGYAPRPVPQPPPGFYARPPSGLFPGPSRPIYREPHPITAAPVLSGFGATLLWFALFGGLAHDLATYAWWTIVASITAWAMAIVLTLLGDRGVAVGIALASGLGLSIAAAFVGTRWIDTYDWPLW